MLLPLFLLSLFGFQEPSGEGLRTPDKDPNQNSINLGKEFSKINRKAEAVLKQLRSFSASVTQESQEAGTSLQGELKAKFIKGKMWVLFSVGEHSGGWSQENIAEKKVTELWPSEKVYRRIDYKRDRKAFPIELFYAMQYRPSKLSKDFTIHPRQVASDYHKIDKGVDHAPEDDPLLQKAKKFENPQREDQRLRTTGPDSKLFHAVDLVPRSATLREKIARVRIWFHYKSFLISRVEVYRTLDAPPAFLSKLTEYKVGIELKTGDVLIKTIGWKKKPD